MEFRRFRKGEDCEAKRAANCLAQPGGYEAASEQEQQPLQVPDTHPVVL